MKRFWSHITFITFIIAGAPALPAAAQGLAPRTLTLTEAMQMAAERNNALILAAIDRDLSGLRAGQARAPFVPVLRVDSEVRERVVTDVGTTRTAAIDGAVRWQTPWGAALSAGADVTAGIASPHSAAIFATASQRLLRGGWMAGAYTPVLEADLDEEIQLATYVGDLNAVLVDVEGAYWALALAQEELVGTLRSLGRAQKQLEDTEENIRRGLLAEGDIHIVAENVVLFEDQVVRSKEKLKLAMSALARLLQLSPGAQVVASDGLSLDDLSVPDEELAVEVALRLNPGLKAARIRARKARVRLAFDENQTLPTLDLEASLRLNGDGGSRAENWRAVAGADQPDLRVGLLFEVPIGQGANNARTARGQLEVRRQLVALSDAEARLRFETRDLLTRIDTQAKRLALAQRRLELARLKLEAQMDKYLNGISTLDEVVRFQRDLDAATLAERRARVAMLETRSRLHEAQGVLHETFGIEVK